MATKARIARLFTQLSVIVFSALAYAQTSEVVKTHAIAMHGSAKYRADFTQFDYTSTNATKGGQIKLHSRGSFDTLNGFVAKGTPAAQLGLIYDTLTTHSADEPFTEYGLLAKTIEYPSDRSWVIYHLDPKARFHDGKPVTASDVAFTFDALTDKGNPFYSFYYADIIDTQVLDSQRIKFVFKEGASKETLLITGQLPVLPQHFWKDKNFESADLTVPLGSGPYKISAIDPGRSIRYERAKDYWAIDHPTMRGQYNFDTVIVDYYRDNTVALEAFKAGEYDYRHETTSKLWATAYEGAPLNDGRMIKEEIAHQNPTGMQAYIFNLRNPVFQDIKLRKAITYVFDFEWTNKNLFYGAYARTNSFFSNSELASSGLPTSQELELLEPFRDQLPESVFNAAYQAPTSAGDKRNRQNLRKAKQILDAAGYNVLNNQLLTPSGQPVSFEILLYDASFERIANPFIQNLKKLGINASLRMVDVSQFINRRRSFEFDMMNHVIGQSLSPGNEQREFWHSAAAATPGSRNLIGIENPVVDALIDHVIEAQTREQLVTATHALDRVLLNMHYVIPQWHSSSHRLAYWNKFNRPSTAPTYDVGYNVGLMTWWEKPGLAPSVQTATGEKN